MYSWKKISRYFGDISPKYHVSMGFDTIFHGEISVRRYFGISREKSPILAIYRWFGDKSPIFRRYIAWSTRVNESQTRYSVVNALQSLLQSLLQCLTFICCWEDLNPKPKGLGFTRLPPGLSCPLIYKMQQLYIYLNSLYKENIRIFLRAN